MKKQDNTPLDLKQLLANVEHAGRDQRRQADLAEMIDQMAAQEKRRPWHWYALRVAAAACVLFFIVTAVRIWYLPTELPANPLVAKAEPVPVPTGVRQEFPPTLPLAAKPISKTVRKAKPAPTQEVQRETAVPEEMPYVAEEAPETPIIEPPAEAPVADSTATTEPEPTLLAGTEVENAPTPVPPQEEAEPRRRSFFSTLFSPAEPDLMDGTVLAFNIL